MKTITKAILTAATLSVVAVSANAANYAGMTGQPYVGVKVGQLKLDGDNAPNLTSYGVYGGYNFTDNFGIEADFNGTDAKDLENTSLAEASAKNYGVYGTYRYNFAQAPVYAKGKLGVAYNDVEVKNKVTGGSVSETETVAAGGVGLGYNLTNNFGVEAMYNIAGKDVQGASIGAHLKF